MHIINTGSTQAFNCPSVCVSFCVSVQGRPAATRSQKMETSLLLLKGWQGRTTSICIALLLSISIIGCIIKSRDYALQCRRRHQVMCVVR